MKPKICDKCQHCVQCRGGRREGTAATAGSLLDSQGRGRCWHCQSCECNKVPAK